MDPRKTAQFKWHFFMRYEDPKEKRGNTGKRTEDDGGQQITIHFWPTPNRGQVLQMRSASATYFLGGRVTDEYD
jgi:hypothetical protein